MCAADPYLPSSIQVSIMNHHNEDCISHLDSRASQQMIQGMDRKLPVEEHLGLAKTAFEFWEDGDVDMPMPAEWFDPTGLPTRIELWLEQQVEVAHRYSGVRYIGVRGDVGFSWALTTEYVRRDEAQRRSRDSQDISVFQLKMRLSNGTVLYADADSIRIELKAGASRVVLQSYRRSIQADSEVMWVCDYELKPLVHTLYDVLPANMCKAARQINRMAMMVAKASQRPARALLPEHQLGRQLVENFHGLEFDRSMLRLITPGWTRIGNALSSIIDGDFVSGYGDGLDALADMPARNEEEIQKRYQFIADWAMACLDEEK